MVNMAARLPLRASAVAAAAPALHGARRIHLLGPRGPPPSVTLRMQARKHDPSFRSYCAQRAEEPEPEHHDSDNAATSGNCELVDMMLKRVQAARAEMGIRETTRKPHIFITEKERISSSLASSRATEGVGEIPMASMVCKSADQALDLASLVMDIARLRPGTIQFCQHTVDQIVRTYAAIFCNVAEDACYKEFNMEAALSFLGAVRGLWAICHILAEDTVAKLKDGRFKNSITYRLGKNSQDFDKMMKCLEDVIAKTEPEEFPQNATNVLLQGIRHAQGYMFLLATCRESALGYLKD